MSGISRREFGRLAAGVGVLGLGATAVACGPPTAPEQTETATPVPDARTGPIRLTQADLDRIIGNHAHTLLDNLHSKTNQPGANYGIAVTFAYPDHQFNPYYNYGTVADQTPPTPRTLFCIGSITKTFATALFANGVVTNPGCVDWDAGLQRYLSGYLGGTGNLSQTMQQITPRMLAQHTSGLPAPSGSPQAGVGLFQTSPSAPQRSVSGQLLALFGYGFHHVGLHHSLGLRLCSRGQSSTGTGIFGSAAEPDHRAVEHARHGDDRARRCSGGPGLSRRRPDGLRQRGFGSQIIGHRHAHLVAGASGRAQRIYSADESAGLDHPVVAAVAQPVRRIPARTCEYGPGLAGLARAAADCLEERPDVPGRLFVLDRYDHGRSQRRAAGHRGAGQHLLDQRPAEHHRRQRRNSDAQRDFSRHLVRRASVRTDRTLLC